MHFSSKKKKTLQQGMSALNKAKECYRHPIFFAGFFWRTRLIFYSLFFLHIEEFRSKEKFYKITNALTISLNFYTKCHVVSKGIRFLALLKKFVKERKRRACFQIIYFSPKNLPVQVNKAESSLFVREKKIFCVKGDSCNQERQLFIVFLEGTVTNLAI